MQKKAPLAMQIPKKANILDKFKQKHAQMEIESEQDYDLQTKNQNQEELQPNKPYQYIYQLPCYIEKDDFWGKNLKKLEKIKQREIKDEQLLVKYIQYFIQIRTNSQQKVNMDNLSLLINELGEDKKEMFFINVLPKMAEEIIDMDNTFDDGLELLNSDYSQGQAENQIQLTRKQIFCLMSMMFLCITIKQTYQKLPNIISFVMYYQRNFQFEEGNILKREKIKFLLEYFFYYTFSPYPEFENEEITIIRAKQRHDQKYDITDWETFGDKVRSVNIVDNLQKGIDDVSSLYPDTKHLKVLFSNKSIGGGVMDQGMVQEEIFWAEYPELYVQRLLVENIRKDEAIFCYGVKKISISKGYGTNTKFEGPVIHDYTSKLDQNYFVSIDAKQFAKTNYGLNQQLTQIQDKELLRELNKAYVGFNLEHSPKIQQEISTVATGNWGCGAFGGNSQIKFIIQLLASSKNYIDMTYFTYNDETLKGIKDVANYLEGQQISCVIYAIQGYKDMIKKLEKNQTYTLFDHLLTYPI